MADTIHIPGLGDVKKSYAIGGAVITVGIVGIAWYRARNNAATAAATAATTATDTTGAYDPNAIDPSTGMPYGAEQSGYGAYGAGNYGVMPASGYGGSNYSGNIIGYDQYGDPIYGTGSSSSSNASGITTNSEWLTQAVSDLSGQGVSTTSAETALSKVLGGITVTVQEQDLFLEAVGIEQAPPQGHPPIKLSNTPGNPGPTGSKSTVPGVVGANYGEAYNDIMRAGLKVSPGRANSAWTVTAQSPKASSSVSKGSTVTLTVKAPPKAGK
jgi:hypothetical protein